MASSQIHPVELIDETLDINATDNYDLTVELSEEGVSIAVLDLLRGKYVMLRHYPRDGSSGSSLQSLNDLVEGDEFLRRNYRKVFIITPSLLYTLVPEAVYESRLRDDYLRFNHPSTENCQVIANSLSWPAAVAVFGVDVETAGVITSRWPKVTPWHHTRPLLHHVFTACRSSEERYIHAHFERSFITIIIAENRVLTFCNSFATGIFSDAGYFLFNVLDKKGVRNSETIHISGTLEPYSEGHLAILNFATNVKFSSPMIRQNFSYVMNEVHLHRWLNLFTAVSCE